MIQVENLTFSYGRGTAPAVRELSFTIEPGEIFGFLGPSGAGKSTTQKILTGLLKGYSGRASVLGRDLAGWKSDYYERIGISFELPNHFLKLTGSENLRYFAALYSGTTLTPDEALAMVGLEQDGATPVEHYSKGMRNRLTLARALLHKPELLFLDEPTSGLDPVNARKVKDLIRAQQREGRTIFLTTHNMAIADELCDRVAFMVDGAIRLVASPRELKLRYGAPMVRVEYANGAGPVQRDFPLSGLGSNDGFLALLQGGGIQTIHTQEATLEDIFIQVTGRSLL